MSDYIKRSDAIKAVNKAKAEGMVECPTYYLGIVPSADTFGITKEALIEAIDNAETVGGIIEGFIATNRPQGEWIEVDDASISCRCSVCGWEAHLYEDDVYGMPYCPNCGARMKGADNE